MYIINFEKKKKIINKRAAGMIWKCKHLFYLQRKIWKKNYLKHKKYCKFRDHCCYTEEYGEAACSIGNLKKNSAPKKNPTAFHNG